jgi:hypothetical protein
MQHSTAHSFGARTRAHLRLAPLVLGVIGSACSDKVVSLGAAPSDVQAAGTCGDGIVVGNVIATHQEDIDALAGCTEITGDLLMGFDGMDLRPLSSLRVVRGLVHVGVDPDSTWSGNPPDRGVASLAGLESLERVGALTLNALLSDDLSPLRHLREVSPSPDNASDNTAGFSFIDIEACDQLRDLSGLESLTVWSRLVLQGNDALESLDGLTAPAEVQSVIIIGGPALHDLTALYGVRAIRGGLNIEATAVQDLNGWGLQSADSLALRDNPVLTDLSGFALGGVSTLLLMDNPRLEQLRGFNVGQELRILDNDALRALPDEFSNFNGSFADDTGQQQTNSFDWFELRGNASLESAHLPRGATLGGRVSIHDNPNLRELDFHDVKALFELSIQNNASLQTVQLDRLHSADTLSVTGNPQLSTAAFSSILSSSKQMSGNLDPSQP